jgi:hypothetical protein
MRPGAWAGQGLPRKLASLGPVTVDLVTGQAVDAALAHSNATSSHSLFRGHLWVGLDSSVERIDQRGDAGIQ